MDKLYVTFVNIISMNNMQEHNIVRRFANIKLDTVVPTNTYILVIIYLKLNLFYCRKWHFWRMGRFKKIENSSGAVCALYTVFELQCKNQT